MQKTTLGKMALPACVFLCDIPFFLYLCPVKVKHMHAQQSCNSLIFTPPRIKGWHNRRGVSPSIIFVNCLHLPSDEVAGRFCYCMLSILKYLIL